MPSPTPEPESFSDDDLLFTCPHCGKNMAIEKQGMGLTIQCPDCRGLVKVPELSEAELERLGGNHASAPGAQPEEIPQIDFLRDVCERILGVQKKYGEIESRFSRQQEAVQALQEEVHSLQETMETLTRQMSESASAALSS